MNAKLEEELRDVGYRVYVTDTLKFISGASERYYDRIQKRPKCTESADDIIANMRKKLDAMSEG